MEKKVISTLKEFNSFSDEFQKEHEDEMPYAFGIGVCHKNLYGKTIYVDWLTINIKENYGTASVLMDVFNVNLSKTPFFCKEFHKDICRTLIIDKYLLPFINDGKKHLNIEALQYLKEHQILGPDSYILIMHWTEEVIFKSPVLNLEDAYFRLALAAKLNRGPEILCMYGTIEAMQKIR